MNTWWEGNPVERFWLEVTDREDIGVDLRAPLLDDSGNDNWRYSLFQRARVGDVVFHYKKPAIVGFSTIAGRSEPAQITWAARGTYARSKGTEPHPRPGYRIPLSNYTPLEQPVTLADLRARRTELEPLLAGETGKRKQAQYFPFELSPNRDLRLLQGYAFKLPARLVQLLPSMQRGASAAATPLGELVAEVVATPKSRNADWTRDELILALDLYVRRASSLPSKTSEEVKELSAVLAAMGRALGLGESGTFRNTNGVYMKLMNFRRFDPAYTSDGRVGLTRGNGDEEVVWNEFTADASRLASVAAAIRAAVMTEGTPPLSGNDEPGIEEAEEGRVLTRVHRVRERDRKLVAEAKRRALRRHGKLMCAACDFEFSKVYGPVAQGIIEVHHTQPLHTLAPGVKTRVDDLALLCANCHRVVHSTRRWLAVSEVRRLVNENDDGRK